ncbi:uncharacterized protein BXZ73DRAFT_58352 [Epithele typhae]|uniref:uncharacterized protein n=1 Tax=Epithele typhae TaxID=378194 RepID=UPI0020081E04|nr:uncharacterized protein BXZ73DRAFT_58352 [Epithele typhae]KAH9910491.1 hypothetical protein BXZ73DRAFT_58352 [Epithele typhae]
MGRWTQYDEDSYRLPAGMKRVGYDSDTGKYYFRGLDGSLWEGPEGAEFGEMRRGGPTPDEEPEDEEADVGLRSDGYAPLAVDSNGSLSSGQKGRANSAYRTILPFFLIIAAVLLLVIRLVGSGKSIATVDCPTNTQVYKISRGNTCWNLADAWGITVDDVLRVNEGLNCDKLLPGQAICLPERKKTQT